MQNQNDPKPIQELMGESSFAGIIQKAQILSKIDQCLGEILPEGLSRYCRVLNIRDNCLILAINNSAIATRIRFQEDTLLKNLDRKLDIAPLMRIECVVRPF